MKIGTMRRLNPDPTVYDGLMHRIVESAQRIEATGFPGIWVGDSLGRGRPTLDPLVALGAIAAVTDRGDPVNTGGTLSNFPGCERRRDDVPRQQGGARRYGLFEDRCRIVTGQSRAARSCCGGGPGRVS